MASQNKPGHAGDQAAERASGPLPTGTGHQTEPARPRSAVQRLRRLVQLGPLDALSFQQLTESLPPIQHQIARRPIG